MYKLHIPSQIKPLSVLKSDWVYGLDDSEHLEPTRGLWFCFPHILGPFVFLGYVRLSKLSLPTDFPFQKNKSIPYVHLYPPLIMLSRSFLLFHPPFQSFSEERNVLFQLQLGHQRDGFQLPERLRWAQGVKASMKKSSKSVRHQNQWEETTGVKWNGTRDGEGDQCLIAN